MQVLEIELRSLQEQCVFLTIEQLLQTFACYIILEAVIFRKGPIEKVCPWKDLTLSF